MSLRLRFTHGERRTRFWTDRRGGGVDIGDGEHTSRRQNGINTVERTFGSQENPLNDHDFSAAVFTVIWRSEIEKSAAAHVGNVSNIVVRLVCR